MNKKKLTIIIISVVIFLALISSIVLIFVNKNKEVKVENTDALKIKEEYESLNNKKSGSGKTYPKVTLSENNKFKYKSAKEIVKTLKSGTGLIYLGFPKCPWCRNAINVLNYVDVNEIMYLDMTNQRDEYSIKDGALTKTKDGTKEYYEMLEILDGILDTYEVSDDAGNKLSANEKRIYVPLVIGVKDGKIVGYHKDTVTLSDNQSPYDLLTKKQQSDLKKIYDDIITKVNDDFCDIENKDHGC